MGRCRMRRMDAEAAIVAAVSAVLAAASIVAIAASESSHRPEPGTPVVVEREDGDGRTALVLDYEGERYVIDIREDV